MSTVKLTADSGGGTVAIAGPSTTESNAALELTLPSSGTGAKIISSKYPSSLQVLEKFYTPCDGSTIVTTGGNITVSDVTAEQDLSSSYVTCSGSSISYTPPTGTTQVIYEYVCYIRRNDTLPLIHFRLSIGGTEVTDFRRTLRAANAHLMLEQKWGFNIGGSAATASGRQSSWTSAKTIMIEAREYSSSQEAYLHSLDAWDGGSSSDISMPCVGITAIGEAS